MRKATLVSSQRIISDASRHYDATPRTRIAASSGVGAQLTATLTVAIGLLAVFCAVVSGDLHTLVAGNALAQKALKDGGIDLLIAYRAVTLAFGLALTVTGIRVASVAARNRATMRRLKPGLQAILSGLVAANLALIAWWTAWLFI